VWERRVYRLLTDADGAERACEAIPEAACTEAPRSFVLNTINGAATKLAEQLASPGLVLAWLLEAVGAPLVLVGWLEPVRQGGSMLPQLAVSAQVRRRAVRKWLWVGAGLVQAVALALMALAAITLDGLAAGLAVLGLLVVFAMASGIGSVAFSDVVGKTIPRGKRGQLLAMRAAIGGGLTLLAGLALRLGGGEQAGRGTYALLVLVAAGLWALAALAFARISELPGASEGGRNALSELRDARHLLGQSGFRRFMLARLALLAAELAVPYYALHARRLGLETHDLGIVIMAVGIANLVSSPIWGRVADRVSSRRVMVLGGLTSVAASVLALVLAHLGSGRVPALLYAPVFLLAGLAIAGIRLGRKTYLVDATHDRDRPLYVSLSNTLSGVATFALGGLGVIAQTAGLEILLVVLLALSLGGALLAQLAPEAEEMATG